MKENEISLIVTDMKMPEMDGIQLLKKANAIKPEIYKIILSGYASTAQIIASINLAGIDRFILKPWDLKTDLKPMIIHGLKEYGEKLKNKLSVISAEKKNELFKKMVSENEDVFTEIEEDFNNIIKLYKMTINYGYLLSSQVNKENITTIRMKEELNYIEAITVEIIKKMPFTKPYFNLKYLNVKINNMLNKKCEIDFKSEISEYYNFNIKFDYIMIISEIVLKSVFKLNKNSKVELIVLANEKENNDKNKGKINFIYKIDSLNKQNDQIRENTNYILLNIFADILNGKLKIVKDEIGKTIVKLEL